MLNWVNLKCYCFPPFSLLPKVLQKVSIERATAVIVIPNWPTQSYYATAMNMLIEAPIFIKKSKTLLQLLSQPKDIHPLWKNLDLLICLVSGEQSKCKDFLNKQQTLLCHHGDLEPVNSMSAISNSGSYTVVKNKLITFNHL